MDKHSRQSQVPEPSPSSLLLLASVPPEWPGRGSLEALVHPTLCRVHLQPMEVLVQKLPALLGTAVTGQFVAGVFNGELIVIGELFPSVDFAHGKDDNVFLAIDVDDPRVAVGLAGMVDEARCVPVHGGIHHLRVINAEHVAPDALCRGDTGGLVQAGQHSHPSRQPSSEAALRECLQPLCTGPHTLPPESFHPRIH